MITFNPGLVSAKNLGQKCSSLAGSATLEDISWARLTSELQDVGDVGGGTGTLHSFVRLDQVRISSKKK